MRVVFDEDIPRDFRGVFEKLEYSVIDVREECLRGSSDAAIFRFVAAQKALLVTGDLGFVQPARFELKKVQGIMINRLPQTLSIRERVRELERILASINKKDLIGYVAVLEIGRIRRRPLRSLISK